MQITTLAQRDQLVDDPLKFFGFWQGCLDLLMLNKRARHVGKQCLAVLMGAV